MTLETSHYICKTPLRVSLLGGGADFDKYLLKKPRYIIGMGINHFIHMNAYNMPGIFLKRSRFQYSKTEEVKDFSKIEHPVIKAVLEKYGIKNGINLSIASDFPSGTGLGSSSCFTCGLINLIKTFNKETIANDDLAYEAITLEQKILKENVGIQDQILCSLGGLRLLKLEKQGFSSLFKNDLYKNILQKLSSTSFIVYTNIQRLSSEVHTSLEKNIKKDEIIEGISDIAEGFINEYSKTKHTWELLSECIKSSWELKKKISISENQKLILEIFDKIEANGADFYKLLGAGNGGFIYCSVKEEKQEKFISSFPPNTVFRIQPSKSGSISYVLN